MKVLEVDKKNIKALYRKGMALRQLSDFEESLACLKIVAAAEPSNAEVAGAVSELRESVAKRSEETKKMVRFFLMSHHMFYF